MTLDTSFAEQHAQRWLDALTSDTAAAVALYADDLVYDDHADSDHMIDTAITKDDLAPRLAPFANKNPDNGLGVHRFTATDAFQLAGVGGNSAVVILWDWTGEGLDTFRGVPTEGKTLSTRASPGTSWTLTGRSSARPRTGMTLRCCRNSACRSSPRRTGSRASTPLR